MAYGVIPTKTCKWCNETKPLNAFYVCNNNVDGKQGHCKACDHKRVKKAEKARVAERKKEWELRTTKTCGHCKEDLAFEMFNAAPNGRWKLRSWCKACESAYHHKRNTTVEGRQRKREEMRAFMKNNPNYTSYTSEKKYRDDPIKRMTQIRSWNLKKKYGITVQEYEDMLAAQGGKCAICETTSPGGNGYSFAVDHFHESGQVRKLLCNKCNAGIGYFKDDPAVVAAAVEYLRRHKA